MLAQLIVYIVFGIISCTILTMLTVLCIIYHLDKDDKNSQPVVSQEIVSEQQSHQVIEDFMQGKAKQQQNMTDGTSLFLYFKAIYPDYKLIFPTIMRMIFPLPQKLIIYTMNYVIENTEKDKYNQYRSTLNHQKITNFNVQLKLKIIEKYGNPGDASNFILNNDMTRINTNNQSELSILNTNMSLDDNINSPTNKTQEQPEDEIQELSMPKRTRLQPRKSVFLNLSNLEQSFAPMNKVYDLRQQLQMSKHEICHSINNQRLSPVASKSELTDPQSFKKLLTRMNTTDIKMLSYQELWHFMIDLEQYVIRSEEYHKASEEYINKKLEDGSEFQEKAMEDLIKLLQQKASILLIFMKNMMTSSLQSMVKKNYIKQVDNYQMRINDAKSSAEKKQQSYVQNHGFKLSLVNCQSSINHSVLQAQRKGSYQAATNLIKKFSTNLSPNLIPFKPSIKHTIFKRNTDKLDSVREIEEDMEEEEKMDSDEENKDTNDIFKPKNKKYSLFLNNGSFLIGQESAAKIINSSFESENSHSSDYSYAIGDQQIHDNFDIEASPTHADIKTKTHKRSKNPQFENFQIAKNFLKESNDQKQIGLNSQIFQRFLSQYKNNSFKRQKQSLESLHDEFLSDIDNTQSDLILNYPEQSLQYEAIQQAYSQKDNLAKSEQNYSKVHPSSFIQIIDQEQQQQQPQTVTIEEQYQIDSSPSEAPKLSFGLIFDTAQSLEYSCSSSQLADSPIQRQDNIATSQNQDAIGNFSIKKGQILLEQHKNTLEQQADEKISMSSSQQNSLIEIEKEIKMSPIQVQKKSALPQILFIDNSQVLDMSKYSLDNKQYVTSWQHQNNVITQQINKQNYDSPNHIDTKSTELHQTLIEQEQQQEMSQTQNSKTSNTNKIIINNFQLNTLANDVSSFSTQWNQSPVMTHNAKVSFGINNYEQNIESLTSYQNIKQVKLDCQLNKSTPQGVFQGNSDSLIDHNKQTNSIKSLNILNNKNNDQLEAQRSQISIQKQDDTDIYYSQQNETKNFSFKQSYDKDFSSQISMKQSQVKQSKTDHPDSHANIVDLSIKHNNDQSLQQDQNSIEQNNEQFSLVQESQDVQKIAQKQIEKPSNSSLLGVNIIPNNQNNPKEQNFEVVTKINNKEPPKSAEMKQDQVEVVSAIIQESKPKQEIKTISGSKSLITTTLVQQTDLQQNKIPAKKSLGETYVKLQPLINEQQKSNKRVSLIQSQTYIQNDNINNSKDSNSSSDQETSSLINVPTKIVRQSQTISQSQYLENKLSVNEKHINQSEELSTLIKQKNSDDNITLSKKSLKFEKQSIDKQLIENRSNTVLLATNSCEKLLQSIPDIKQDQNLDLKRSIDNNDLQQFKLNINEKQEKQLIKIEQKQVIPSQIQQNDNPVTQNQNIEKVMKLPTKEDVLYGDINNFQNQSNQNNMQEMFELLKKLENKIDTQNNIIMPNYQQKQENTGIFFPEINQNKQVNKFQNDVKGDGMKDENKDIQKTFGGSNNKNVNEQDTKINDGHSDLLNKIKILKQNDDNKEHNKQAYDGNNFQNQILVQQDKPFVQSQNQKSPYQDIVLEVENEIESSDSNDESEDKSYINSEGHQIEQILVNSVNKSKKKGKKKKKVKKKSKQAKKGQGSAIQAQDVYSEQHIPKFEVISKRPSMIDDSKKQKMSLVKNPSQIDIVDYSTGQNISQQQEQEVIQEPNQINKEGQKNIQLSHQQKFNDDRNQNKQSKQTQQQLNCQQSPQQQQKQPPQKQHVDSIQQAKQGDFLEIKISDVDSPIQNKNSYIILNNNSKGLSKANFNVEQNQLWQPKDLELHNNDQYYSKIEDELDFGGAYNMQTKNEFFRPNDSLNSPMKTFKSDSDIDISELQSPSRRVRVPQNIPVDKVKTFQMKMSIIKKNSCDNLGSIKNEDNEVDNLLIKRQKTYHQAAQSTELHRITPYIAFDHASQLKPQKKKTKTDKGHQNQEQQYKYETDERMQTLTLDENEMSVSSESDQAMDAIKPTQYKGLFQKIMDRNDNKQQQFEQTFGGNIGKITQDEPQNLNQNIVNPKEKVSSSSYMEEFDKLNFCYILD